MNVHTVINDKLEALHEATQARVDATQAEARAAINVIVTSVLSACPTAQYIEFDRDEISGAVGFARSYGSLGTCDPSEEAQAFWHQLASLIAADEFLTADIEGLTLEHAADHEWLLDLARYRTSSGD